MLARWSKIASVVRNEFKADIAIGTRIGFSDGSGFEQGLGALREQNDLILGRITKESIYRRNWDDLKVIAKGRREKRCST